MSILLRFYNPIPNIYELLVSKVQEEKAKEEVVISTSIKIIYAYFSANFKTNQVESPMIYNNVKFNLDGIRK